jgi:hypothetical protein
MLSIGRPEGNWSNQRAGEMTCSTAGTFYWAVWLARRSRTVGAGRHWRDKGPSRGLGRADSARSRLRGEVACEGAGEWVGAGGVALG